MHPLPTHIRQQARLGRHHFRRPSAEVRVVVFLALQLEEGFELDAWAHRGYVGRVEAREEGVEGRAVRRVRGPLSVGLLEGMFVSWERDGGEWGW
jgi:hypothetical protein